MRVLVFRGVPVIASTLLELVELAAIVPRSFVHFLYFVVMVAVSRLRTTLLLVATEARDSK